MGLLSRFSGKDKYREAKYKYDDAVDEYEKARKHYLAETESLNEKIVMHIDKINYYKEYIQTELFRDFVEMLSLLKDVEIPEEFCEEKYQKQCRQLDSFMKVKSRDALISIDFDGQKIKTALQSIFTLGFYTRKRANESLLRVNEEKAALRKEMSEMDCELAKLETLAESSMYIAYYFMKMSNLFEKWLRYMEHAIHYIGYASMRMNKRILKRSISISILHEKQQKELEATITLGKVLSQMIQVQVVIGKDGSNLEDYKNKMQVHYQKYKDEAAV